MKLVYLGTPDMAVPPLRALVDAGHEIVLVVTRADKRRGRGGSVTPSPVKAAALELGLPVSHSVDDVLTAVRDDGAELGVVVAFGQIIKPHVLDRIRMVNLHFSLLPRWRGAAPVERALLAGDPVTGVCVMALEEGLDTGGVYARSRSPDRSGDHRSGAALRTRRCRHVVAGRHPRPTARRLDRPPRAAGGRHHLCIEVRIGRLRDRLVSAPRSTCIGLIRIGGAWTTFRGKRLKINEARLVDGRVVPVTVQPEGKPAMAFDAWRNGARPAPDELFGDL